MSRKAVQESALLSALELGLLIGVDDRLRGVFEDVLTTTASTAAVSQRHTEADLADPGRQRRSPLELAEPAVHDEKHLLRGIHQVGLGNAEVPERAAHGRGISCSKMMRKSRIEPLAHSENGLHQRPKRRAHRSARRAHYLA